jgi:hypothetical protein
MLRRTAALIALLLLGSGCAASDVFPPSAEPIRPPSPGLDAGPAPVSAAERDWLFRLGEWASFATARAGSRACSTALRADVGDAPTRRLEQLERLAARACRQLEDPSSKDGARLVDAVAEAIYSYVYASGDSRPLPSIAGRTSRSRIDPHLTKVVTRLIARPTEVRCWSRADWNLLQAEVRPYTELAGYAGSTRIHLLASGCAPLVELYQGRLPTHREARSKLASAIDLLAHESEHRRGVLVEARAECFAIQDVRRFARALGAPERLAAELPAIVWEEQYPFLPDEYRTPLCRDGGPLDMNPRSRVFP